MNAPCTYFDLASPSVEIPNKDIDLDTYEAVAQFMMHAWTMWCSN